MKRLIETVLALSILVVVSPCSSAVAGRPVQAQSAPPTAAPAPPGRPAEPVPMSGHPLAAAYDLYVQGSKVGHIESDLTAAGRYTRKFTITMGGQSTETIATIEPDAQGRWVAMEITGSGETVTVKRLPDGAEFHLLKKNQTYTVKLPSSYVVYDNYGPTLDGFMLRRYDMAKGGVQKIFRYIAPSTSTEVTLEDKGVDPRPVGGKVQALRRFDMTLLGIEVHYWADEALDPVLMEVPVQKAAFVRTGYEELMRAVEAEAQDPLLSKPVFDVRRETVMMPMRDGVKLATDLYFPRTGNAADRFPVILIRTPYKKDMAELTGNDYARRGYVAAIQDCRGRFSSEGTWAPMIHEGKDGYDTIEWLGTRDWSSGKVGMIGGSYVGWVQLWAAVEKPPHLATIIPNVAPPDPMYNMPYEYGAFFTLGAIWWAEILESNATGDITGRTLAEINQRKYETILRSLPVVDLDLKILGRKNAYWRDWIAHPTDDAYWKPVDFMEKLKTLEIPVFLQSGWFDGDGIGTKLNYAALRGSKSPAVKVVIGPWGHTDTSVSRVGDHDFGPAAAPDLQAMYLRWFDRWLKGVDNKIDSEPLAQYFVMFSNTWVKGPVYPVPETRFTKYYLESDRGANTSRGDGLLALEPPAGGRESDAYVYDPGDPTPWPEYYFKSDEEAEREKGKPVDTAAEEARARAFHASVTEKRNDILVFQTPPLEAPVSVAGPISAELYASTSAPDTDWYMTLMDVDEKGQIFHLAHGVARARYRSSLERPELLKGGEVVKYALDLWQTGITFQKGHRIRVEVASAMFPLFSRNLNTGGRNETETKFRTADQRIFHSARYPSHVLLPVVDAKD